jgi:pimeloyl-ACP methyl ester carboxylesterase
MFNEFLNAKPISEGRIINTKTLLIAADKDEIATVESVKELMGRFSDGNLKIMQNSGHIVPAERPKRVAKIICSWLATPSAVAPSTGEPTGEAF